MYPTTPRYKISPWLVAVGSRGYEIQSKVLHIPDALGPFSPGPPPLQAHEGGEAVLLVTTLLFTHVVSALAKTVIWYWKPEYYNSRFVMGFLREIKTVSIFFLLTGWIQACLSSRRDPDYQWGTWELDGNNDCPL